MKPGATDDFGEQEKQRQLLKTQPLFFTSTDSSISHLMIIISKQNRFLENITQLLKFLLTINFHPNTYKIISKNIRNNI